MYMFSLYHIVDEETEEVMHTYNTIEDVRNFLLDFWVNEEEHFYTKKEHKNFLRDIKHCEDISELNSFLGGIGHTLEIIEQPSNEEQKQHFEKALRRYTEEGGL